jgi:hypothetical protein
VTRATRLVARRDRGACLPVISNIDTVLYIALPVIVSAYLLFDGLCWRPGARSMRNARQRVGVPLLAIVALLGGIWLGEDIHSPLRSLQMLGVLGLLAGCVAAPLARPGWRKPVVASVGVVALALVGFLTGDRIGRHAFNSCVEEGDPVRAALEQFKARRGRYPDSLRDLEMKLPGKRFLRANILFYRRRNGGYVLAFSDWLVSHSATEDGGWHVVK